MVHAILHLRIAIGDVESGGSVGPPELGRKEVFCGGKYFLRSHLLGIGRNWLILEFLRRP